MIFHGIGVSILLHYHIVAYSIKLTSVFIL